MSGNRLDWPIESQSGVWSSPYPILCRYLEVEPISGAGLYVRWSGPLAPANAVSAVSQYDAAVPVFSREVIDLGTEDRWRISVADISGSPFGARLRTDTSPILSSPAPRTFATEGVTVLNAVDVLDRAARQLGQISVAAPGSCIPFVPTWGPADGADKQIIAPVVGKSIKLRKLSWGYVWAGGTGLNTLALKTSGGATLGSWRLDSSGADFQFVPGLFDFEGYPLPVGEFLLASIGGAPPAGVTVAAGGVLTYTQS